MSNIPDWEKKYWATKQQQNNVSGRAHYKSTHIINNTQQRQTGNEWGEIDPLTAIYSNIDRNQKNIQHKIVSIKSGANYYKSVQTGNFGSTVPLVKNCGQYNENIQRDFEMKNSCRCYIIDQLQTVDLSNLDPNKMVELVQISAPFVGTILVEKKDINYCGGNDYKNKQLLKG